MDSKIKLISNGEEDPLNPFFHKLAIRGKEPPMKSNWLADLPIGTVFLARPNSSHMPDLYCFEIKDKIGLAVMFYFPKTEEMGWVDSKIFSDTMTWYLNIKEGDE